MYVYNIFNQECNGIDFFNAEKIGQAEGDSNRRPPNPSSIENFTCWSCWPWWPPDFFFHPYIFLSPWPPLLGGMCYIWSCRLVVALQWLICTVRGTIFWGYLSLLRRGKYCYRISTLDSFNSEFLENWCHTFFLSQCKIIFICCVKNGSPSRLASPGPPQFYFIMKFNF